MVHSETWLEVIDKDGWQKKYSLEKGIIFIGSDPALNQIHLAGERDGAIAPRHAQLIGNGSGTGFQLVNLTDRDIALGAADTPALPPHRPFSLSDGVQFTIGAYTLVFHSAAESRRRSLGGHGSRYIGLDLSLGQTQLAPGQYLAGLVIVSNLGDQSGVQFELALTGLDTDCFDLEPGPLLSAGAEEEVAFHLYHRGIKPPAGELTFTIQATAPRAYVGEVATISQVIQVLPLYRHRLRLLTPGEASAPLPIPLDELPLKARGDYRTRPTQPALNRQPAPPPEAEAEKLWSAEISVPVTSRPKREPRSTAPEPPPASPPPEAVKQDSPGVTAAPLTTQPAPPDPETSHVPTAPALPALPLSTEMAPPAAETAKAPTEAALPAAEAPAVRPRRTKDAGQMTTPQAVSGSTQVSPHVPERPKQKPAAGAAPPPGRGRPGGGSMPRPSRPPEAPGATGPGQPGETRRPAGPPPAPPPGAKAPPAAIWEAEPPPKPARKTSAEVKASSDTADDEWWPAAPEHEPPLKKKPALKLKAEPDQTKAPPAEPAHELPPEVEAWWSDEQGASSQNTKDQERR